MPDLLTVTEAALILRVSARTIQRLCASGDLPAFRVRNTWRIHRTDLTEYVEVN